MSVLTDRSKNTKIVASTSSKKLKKPNTRNLVFGRRSTPEKILQEIVELSKTHKIAEIVEITGKSESTIKRYLKKGKKLGVVNISEGGRLSFSDAQKLQQYSIELTKDDFAKKYPRVEKWVFQRTAEAKGDLAKLRRVKQQLGRLKVVCDSTKTNPIMMLAPNEDGIFYGGLMNIMTAFVVAMTEQRVCYLSKNQPQPDPDNIENGFRENLMACRNFAMYSGVAIPKLPKDHILSGKKTSFGKFADVKMSDDEINKCIELLIEKFGRDSIQVAMAIFYYFTGTRAKSIYPVLTSTITTLNNGWKSCRVYESKTHKTWKKYIPNDVPHFDILNEWFEKRIKDGKEFIFSENGKVLEQFHRDYNQTLGEIYKKVGLTDPYFYAHQTHSWRHVSGHWWRGRGYSDSAVCKIVGWDDMQTFVSCYGEVSDDEILKTEIPK